MSKHKFYGAYGSNLNLDQLSYRAKTANVVGASILENYKLVFRGHEGNAHATIEKANGYFVPIGVFEIYHNDELALDRYEGYPIYYDKITKLLKVENRNRRVMLYKMNEMPLATPSSYYLETIRKGYRAFGFDTQILDTALAESKTDIEETH